MQILTPTDWQDYILLDSGNGQRLEKYGSYTLVRPDPQCIWQPQLPKAEWQKADAVFAKTSGDKGVWKKSTKIPDKWLCKWNNLSLWVKLSPFKHTGVFPEQAIQWGFIQQSVIARRESTKQSSQDKNPTKIATLPPVARNDEGVNILNLFGYTGIASLAAASTGAKVTHVDASYPTIGWARENQQASNLTAKPIRWILDDALKFCERELRRGTKYDGIIMDPPIYGHGPKGEIWNFENEFPKLVDICRNLLSNKPLFFIVNAYAISASAIMLENVLNDYLQDLGGQIESGELALQEAKNGRLLSTGIFARWSNVPLQ